MIVLIPSYEPDERLPQLVADLTGVDGLRVVVVDDGSGPAYATHFDAARRAGAEVLTHPRNRGKGAALRTGFAHVLDTRPGEPVVCADSDGQHTLLDILKVAAAIDGESDMVLGARRFTGRVPLRSRFGNAVTRGVFALVTGKRLHDTQTGLRGYPHRMLGWLLAVPGDRFEYELELLLRASREGLRVREVEIATVYLAGNASSHFRPVRDSLRIYRPLLAFAGSSLAGFAVDATLVFALYALTANLALSVVAARLISGTVNFLLNRRLVFAATDVPLWPSVRRYVLLAAAVLLANLGLMELLTPVLGVVAAKLLTEVSLFLAGYVVQRRVVFTRTPVDRARSVVPLPERSAALHEQVPGAR
ncbi:MAG: bifunctional glycosyltransferase family 2/GtrA family protein [Propionicimonas sp.]|uniref:glycosyltransferase n=1 Tax=Propionicimonas sp. TaxID=1955623 RepID=UPI003D0A2CD0